LRAKVFGLNALKPYEIDMDEVLLRAGNDPLSKAKVAYMDNPQPHYRTYGPKTRREFMNLLKLTGGNIS
jgi:hypothetical protein